MKLSYFSLLCLVVLQLVSNNNIRLNLGLDDVEPESLEKDDEIIKQSKCDYKPFYFITGVFSQLGLDLLNNKPYFEEHKIVQCVDNLMVVIARYVANYKETTLNKKDGIFMKSLHYASDFLGKTLFTSIIPFEFHESYNDTKELLKSIYTKNIKPIFATLKEFFKVFNLADFILISQDCLGKLKMPVNVDMTSEDYDAKSMIGTVFNSNNTKANSLYNGMIQTQRKYDNIVNDTDSNLFSKTYNDLFYALVKKAPDLLHKLKKIESFIGSQIGTLIKICKNIFRLLIEDNTCVKYYVGGKLLVNLSNLAIAILDSKDDK